MDENNSKQIEIRTLLDDSENIVIWPITRADAVQRQNNSSVEASLQITEEALTRCVYVDEEEDVDIEDLNPTTPTSAVTSVNGKIGNVVLNATDVGARPNTWMPTAADVGARSNNWMPTASQVGARSNTWLPTTTEIGAMENKLQSGAERFDGADLNCWTTSGIYFANGTEANVPPGAGGSSTVIVFNADSGNYNLIQLYSIHNSGINTLYMRSKMAGGWTGWTQLTGPSNIDYSTIAPTSNNTEGGLKVCVLNSEPTTKYEGWLYLIKE